MSHPLLQINLQKLHSQSIFCQIFTGIDLESLTYWQWQAIQPFGHIHRQHWDMQLKRWILIIEDSRGETYFDQ